MLASITPLGERGRGSVYVRTVVAFALAAGVAGAALGALAGAVGAALPGGGEAVRAAVLAAALVLALAVDAAGARVPGPRRQVDERWLHAYRDWVYGAGFGAQLGAGVTTIVATALVYVALLAALLAGDPALGAAVGACFGLGRAATLLAGARVRRPAQLQALHARLRAWRPRAARLTLAAEVGLACACAGAALG